MTIASSQTLTLPLALFPVLRDGEKNRREAKRLVDCEDNLIGKVKVAYVSKAKREICSLLCISKQMPSCSLESRASSQHMLLFWKRNSITLNILLSSSILFYCWACCCTVWNFPWETASKSLLPKCQFGSATPAMSLSNLLPSPSWEGGRVWREALDASAQALSSSSQEWSGTSMVLGTAGKHNSHGLLGKRLI